MTTLEIERGLEVAGTTTNPAAISAARRARGRDRLWIAELSQIWGGDSWLYFGFVLDRDTRRCLGWAPHRVPHAELIAEALGQAVRGRDCAPGAPAEVPVVFTAGCRTVGADLPRWTIPSASDSALCAGFVNRMRRELLDELENHDRAWASFPEARAAVGEWIEATYNARDRRGRTLQQVA